MNFFVYIIKTTTKTITKTYVGYTNNLKNRLDKHNNNQGAKSTKGHKWKIIYKKKYLVKSTAMRDEYKLKKDYNLRNKIKINYLKNE